LGGRGRMTERDRLLAELSRLDIKSIALTLPGEPSSLLDYDLTLQQLRVFAFVYGREETSITKVADALSINPNVATGIIQRLVDRGLSERREDPADRRVRLLTVTELGSALIDDLAAIIMAKLRTSLERLSDEQLRQLRELLAAMGSPA